MATAIEYRILINCIDSNPTDYYQSKLRHLLSRDIDVDLLIDMAVDEGMTGYLYRSLLASSALEFLDDNQKERIRNLYYQNVIFNLKLIHDVKEFLSKLSHKNMSVVLLKGIVLLQQIYEDIGLRKMTDVDLWLQEKDYRDVTDTLSSLGYVRDPVHPDTFRRGRTTFDLRFHLLEAERIRSRKFIIKRHQDHIFKETVTIDFEDEKALCLNRYDQLIYLSLHALKHNLERLIWLMDIKRLIDGWRPSDWNALMDRAIYLGQEKSLSYVFFLLREIFHVHLPPDARRVFERYKQNVLERKLLRARVKGERLPQWGALVLFSPSKGVFRRAYSIYENLFPPVKTIRQIFSDTHHLQPWKLYVRRIPHLIGMAKKSPRYNRSKT